MENKIDKIDHAPTINEMLASWMNEEWNPIDGPFYHSDVLAAAHLLDKMQIVYPTATFEVYEYTILGEGFYECWKNEGDDHRLLSMAPSLPLAICNAWLSIR